MKAIIFVLGVIAVLVLFFWPKNRDADPKVNNCLLKVLIALLGGALVIVQTTFGIWSSYALRRLDVQKRAERGVNRFGIDLGVALQVSFIFECKHYNKT